MLATASQRRMRVGQDLMSRGRMIGPARHFLFILLHLETLSSEHVLASVPVNRWNLIRRPHMAHQATRR